MPTGPTQAKKAPKRRPVSDAKRKRIEMKHAKMGVEPVALSIKGVEGMDLKFKIRRWTPMSKVIETFAKRKDIDPNGLSILYNGQKYHGNETPYTIGMDDVAEVEIKLFSQST